MNKTTIMTAIYNKNGFSQILIGEWKNSDYLQTIIMKKRKSEISELKAK